MTHPLRVLVRCSRCQMTTISTDLQQEAPHRCQVSTMDSLPSVVPWCAVQCVPFAYRRAGEDCVVVGEIGIICCGCAANNRAVRCIMQEFMDTVNVQREFDALHAANETQRMVGDVSDCMLSREEKETAELCRSVTSLRIRHKPEWNTADGAVLSASAYSLAEQEAFVAWRSRIRSRRTCCGAWRSAATRWCSCWTRATRCSWIWSPTPRRRACDVW